MERNNKVLKKSYIPEQEYHLKLSKIFNNLSFGLSSVGNPSTWMNIHFPKDNERLKNSNYFLNDKKNLIHFTSLKALYSIINEQTLRLYNLNNSNDQYEYNYAANNYGAIYRNQGSNQNDIDLLFNKLKTNAFILSLTECKELYNDFFWQSYADNGRGVAIEFEIVNEPLEWENFYFTKVKYGGLEKIKQAIKEVKKLQAKNHWTEYNLELNPFFALHKKNIEKWRKENEIRILTHNSFLEEFVKYIYNDVKNNGNELIYTQYIKLPLYNMKSLEVNKCRKIPDLKISKIYFGSNINYPNIYPNSGFNDFRNELWHYIVGKFGNILDYKDLIDINELNRKILRKV